MSGLRASGVHAGYPGNPGVLRDLHLDVRRGELVVLVGPNGSGKSTIVRVLSRVLALEAGSVELDGRPIGAWSRWDVAKRVAVVPQVDALPEGYRASSIVRMGRSPHLGLLGHESARDRAICEEAMRRTATLELRDREVTTLSGGERQRVVLARALAQQPTYLLLDEPTSHLDLRYQVEILRYVRSEVGRGIGALVVMHDVNLAARAADRLLVLDHGQVVADGPPGDVITERLLRDVYRADVAVTLDATGGPVVLPRVR